MAKGDKYIGLKKYLQSSITPIVTLSFNDIEQIIGDKLPKSAYNHAEVWWANDHTHSQSIAWIDSEYETDYVTDTYKDEKIIFVKR
ncbi:hypothetical protein KM803_15565 [Clostridium tyrobutyricum]|uniref:DUF7662 domain-containing protein n=1 Tax=Clostridium tyrobutyricum TaxID=1519 RepID=UPI001C3930BF|nr:hypothetical protein [Clostridium tyrobutyricum]MBV4432721.1 hypothetical protein [Clostridium tyrobutyricum]